MGILTSIRMGASVKISSGPSGHQHSQSQRCCCLFAPYFVIQIRMILWYRKLQEYSKLTEKSIRTWPENGRGNMLCDEKNGGQKPLEHTEKIKKKHTNSFFSKTTPDRIENPFILKSPSRYSKSKEKTIFFFKKIGLSIIFFSISLCPSNQKVINWKNFGFIKTFPLVFFYYTNFSPFFEI